MLVFDVKKIRVIINYRLIIINFQYLLIFNDGYLKIFNIIKLH